MADDGARHWDGVYSSKVPSEVSWFQQDPAISLRLLTMAVPWGCSVIDVGAGASRLADALLDAGWTDVTALDVSSQALDTVRQRLAHRSETVSFVVADLLDWEPPRSYDAWHDRAVFHFLVDPPHRQHYIDVAAQAVAPGGALVLGAFALDGPDHCSGLPTAGYDEQGLADLFTPAFRLAHAEREEHVTPAGAVQPFTWVVLRRC